MDTEKDGLRKVTYMKQAKNIKSNRNKNTLCKRRMVNINERESGTTLKKLKEKFLR